MFSFLHAHDIVFMRQINLFFDLVYYVYVAYFVHYQNVSSIFPED